MCNQQRAQELLRKANRAYADGDFLIAENTLLEASKIPAVEQDTKEHIYDCLSAMACEQGRFVSSAWWYQQVLQIRTHRLAVGDPMLASTIKSYRAIQALCERRVAKQRMRLTA